MRRVLSLLGPVAVAVSLGVAGCATGGDAARSAPSPSEPGTSSASSSPDPVEACVRQVTYWVGESLRLAPDQGFDYQHMGLSGATYDVVREVTAQAREAPGDPTDLVARRALEECRRLKGPGASPTDGDGTGWP